MMPTVSIKTAERLDKAGLKRVWQEGDYYGNEQIERQRYGGPLVHPGFLVHTAPHVWWLPRLDQVIDALWSIEGVDDISFHRLLNPDSPYECGVEYIEGIVWGAGLTTAEAAGACLATMLEERVF